MEMYVLPVLIYTSPRLARNVLRYRYSLLDQARERARAVSQKRALFAWRTINGEEASAYYAAGTAQYHINAAIALGVVKYVEITGDKDFLYECGAEILVETARLWLDLGFFSERHDGRFCIHRVTGPDEYTTVVNNKDEVGLVDAVPAAHPRIADEVGGTHIAIGTRVPVSHVEGQPAPDRPDRVDLPAPQPAVASESGSNVNLTISGAEIHCTRNVQEQHCVVRVTSG